MYYYHVHTTNNVFGLPLGWTFSTVESTHICTAPFPPILRAWPYQLNLICCNTVTICYIPRLTAQNWGVSCWTLPNQSHLCNIYYPFTVFLHQQRFTAVPHEVLHTTAAHFQLPKVEVSLAVRRESSVQYPYSNQFCTLATLNTRENRYSYITCIQSSNERNR